ncbi:MAG TPA: arginine--tRNA ligase [Candidatus Acidoferrales bacterium]
MYKVVEERFRKALRHHIHDRYKTDVPIVTERPPKLSMGEAASPVCFELAKRMKKAPRALAQEIANSLKPIKGIARVEVAGGGYLNAFFERGEFFRAAAAEAGNETVADETIKESSARDRHTASATDVIKTVVEHTSINPNKAAHIGHLRNAVLGDTFARLLRHAGRRVEVQNYIDNTGVQVADVVLGFLHIEKKSVAEVAALAAAPKFDYLCWDLYARVTLFLADDKSRLELRNQTLKDIEEGHGDAAAMAEVVSTAINHCHLRTLDRLGIDYDLLTQESEILRLKFWDAAFAMLKQRGAVELATSGKNAGCWIMQLPPERAAVAAPVAEAGAESTEAAVEENPEEADAKVIVRSTGTVTYVGKDIALHLWKFGLLDRDFHYRRFHKHPDGHEAWVTSSERDDPGAPKFGHAQELFNVIDSRQAYPQKVVVAALRALGYNEEADHLKHFAYNVVALTPRCAIEMGYEIPEEDAKRPYIEVSGRKGQGVKADDLLDQLEASARKEVDARQPDAPEAERAAIAHAIAIGALRYFLLRFTRSTVIAFDFKDALSFEGETGPYVQYAVVRVNGILRKGSEMDPALTIEDATNIAKLREGEIDAGKFLGAPVDDDIWDLVVLAGSLDARLEVAIASLEPNFLTRFAFELAQMFNVFYHKHHILKEQDAEKRAFLLAVTALVREQLVIVLGLLGIRAPERM